MNYLLALIVVIQLVAVIIAARDGRRRDRGRRLFIKRQEKALAEYRAMHRELIDSNEDLKREYRAYRRARLRY